MSDCQGTRIIYKAPHECILHPTSKYPEAARVEEDECRPYKHLPPPPHDCGRKGYWLYAIPLLIYIPWALRKMRCSPKCCPPPTCCPQVKCIAEQNTCCAPNPIRGNENYQPKQQKDFRCGKNRKACGESED
nr:uncharacterized protein LOC106683106 [Halyomorpha halys]